MYSQEKILHHKDVLELLRDGKPINPLHVYLVPSDLCNHDCPFCSYRIDGYSYNELFHVIEDGEKNHNPNRMIPVHKCFEIIDDCREMGVKAIQITGGGEPTLHPDILAILHRINASRIDLGFTTNGMKLRGIEHELMHAKWVRVSIDAADPDTYSERHGVSKFAFSKVLNNIATLNSIRNYTASEVVIGTSFVVTRENWWEIPKFAKLMSDSGADNVRFTAFFQPDQMKYYEHIYSEVVRVIGDAKKYASKRFKVIDVFSQRVDALQSPECSTCYQQRLATFIGGDQNVYRCCNTSYSERGFLGSVKNQSLKTLWESSEVRDKLSQFNARDCSFCMFDHKNSVVDSRVSIPLHTPDHVNFV